jgi:hypothetical protein
LNASRNRCHALARPIVQLSADADDGPACRCRRRMHALHERVACSYRQFWFSFLCLCGGFLLFLKSVTCNACTCRDLPTEPTVSPPKPPKSGTSLPRYGPTSRQLQAKVPA